MRRAEDPYPTRVAERRAPLPRLEPVVHAQGAQRRAGPLTEEQLASFERDGFLVLQNYLPAADMQAFLDDLDAYHDDPELQRRPEVIREHDGELIRSIFAIHRLSTRCDALTRDPQLLGMARQILGTDAYIHQSRLNRKPAFWGRGFDWHSDFETWHAEDGMPRMHCLSVSVSLTDNHALNGPLMLVPGSHRWFIPTLGETPDAYWETSLKRQSVGVPHQQDLTRAAANGGMVAAQGGPGTVILFDCNCLHASTDNLSPQDRSNVFFVYNSVENELQTPFAAPRPRPEWVASRAHVEPLSAPPGDAADEAPLGKLIASPRAHSRMDEPAWRWNG